MRFHRSVLSLALFSLPLVASQTRATNCYWDGTTTTVDGASQGGSGTWSTSVAAWDTGSGAEAVWTNGNTAVFGGPGGAVGLGAVISAAAINFTAGGYTVAATTANTLGLTTANLSTGSTTLPSISIIGTNLTDTIGGPVTLVGSTAAVTSGANTAYLTVGTGNTLNLTGSVTQSNITGGSGTTAYLNAVTLNGGGAVNFSGSAFTPGKFTIIGGTNFTSSAGTITISNNGIYTGIGDATAGSQWNITGGTVADAAILFIGNGTGTSGALTISGGTASFAGINAGNSYNGGTTNNDSTGTITVNGGTLTNTGPTKLGSSKSGVGTLNLNGGTYAASGTFSVPIGTAGTGGNGTINFNGGTLQVGGTSLSILSTITSKVLAGGAVINTNSNSASFNTSFLTGVSSGLDGGLTKNGTGTLTLLGANTYNGGTTVNAGTLAVGSGGTLGATTSALTVNNPNTAAGTAVTLNLAMAVDTVTGSLSGTISTPASGTNAVTINNGGSGRNFTVNQTVAGTFGGVIVGAGAFTLGGASTNTLTLSGANAYSGGTNIAGGTLTAASNSALSGANVAVGVAMIPASGTATLNFTSAAPAVASLASSGAGTSNVVLGGASTATALTVGGTGNLSSTFAGTISDNSATNAAATGSLVKANTGTFTLTGTNTYTGLTMVNAGTLLVNGSTSTSSAVTVANSGTLGGIGTVGGTVTINNGGTISAGSGTTVGTLTTGALTLATGSTFNAFTAGDGSYSRLSAVGTTDLSNAAFSVTVPANASFTAMGEALELIPSAISGIFTNTTYTAGGYHFTADYTSNPGFFDVDVTPVPEPATWFAGFLMFGSLGFSQRRRLGGLFADVRRAS